MSKLFLIAQREFLIRIKSKIFIVVTLLMPLLMVASLVVPVMLAQVKSSSVATVGIIDKTGLYMSEFQDTDQFHFVDGEKELLPDDAATISITGDLCEDSDAAKISSSKEINPMLVMHVENVLNSKVYRDKMLKYNMPELQDIIMNLNQRVSIQTVRVEENGEEQATSTTANSVSGIIVSSLIFIFILMYGNMVLQSVIEEKTSRIVEIMASSVSPVQLMLGKMLGVFLLGLAQIAVWILLYFGIMAVVSSIIGGDSSKLESLMSIRDVVTSLPLCSMAVLFMVFFIGGYMLYAGIYAALGSSVNSVEEAQQFNSPMMILLTFAYYASMSSARNPDGPLAFWASLIPITSPIVMMVRVPFGVPAWELALSIALLFATALAIIWIGAKIYRTGILMYGKKPSFKEILKWLRYK